MNHPRTRHHARHPRIGVATLLVATIGLTAGVTAGCAEDVDPSTPTDLAPDETQPVNSITQDSANVPGGGLDPQPPSPENP